MKKEAKTNTKGKSRIPEADEGEIKPNKHLGSSNAFEGTENTLSRDRDNVSDEMLDELIGDE
jgi:hypothetical protein